MIRRQPVWMLLALACPLAGWGLASRGQDQVPASATEGLEFMKAAARSFQIESGERGGALRLQEEPAFRLGKQYTDVLEGAIFLWFDEANRPGAAVQIFKLRYAGAPLGLWIHSFSSLSLEPLSAERDGRMVWSPRTPGVEFRSVPGAPRPGESTAQRSRQLRALAHAFHAADDFRKQGWRDLRLLPTPIARYGAPGTNVPDGAMFAFVEGTDPEVVLFLEVRSGAGGPEWHYALAPMTVFAVKASYQGRHVWELPDRKPAKDPARPFFDYVEKTARP
jgi:hypothetical protein